MRALYRKRYALPSLALALLLPGCDRAPPPNQCTAPLSDTYLEALQEVEALKHSLDQHDREQQHMDELLGPNQDPVR